MADLKSYLPWASQPLIVNAPMAGFANGNLASAVSLAGGLGLIGGLFSIEDLRKDLTIASTSLKSISSPQSTLPIGVGLLPFISKIEDISPVIAEFKPTVVWLFATKELDDYATWASAIRQASPETKIWIQVGSVSAALHVSRTASPDALCLQGADAGGHGFERGAGIISLLPEASDALSRSGFGHIPLIAAGGIVDGRGVTAALALGAQAVVMGTRFLAAREVTIHPNYLAAVLGAEDGGQVTTRSKVFDELRGPSIWPDVYDGRSLVVKSWREWKEGTGIEEIRAKHNEEAKGEDGGYRGLEGRTAIWAGTGVGIVRKVEDAGDIVRGIKEEVESILARLGRR
ncbi:hypothetical protein B0J11DRAFT_542071 [Dendryphion nanum]|uniref:Inosine monophosphate dehydrogenase n=1 Tax=Dendryphion nanum TaxID=256645 RepID=A0A9P9D5N0_9PLEO|nr:hypothetical protein B0J11DRAFT_542071 [Dendryphion nanum]